MWGTGNSGELGLGHENNVALAPICIPDSKTIHFSQICAGDHHNLALSKSGLVYSW